MALTLGTDTYLSVEDIQAWCDARGYQVDIDDACVLRAMDYLEALPWSGAGSDDGLFWGDSPPAGVVKALCLAAKMEAESPGVLSPEQVQRIQSESVAGAVSVTYESGGSVQELKALNRLLRAFIRGGGSIRVRLA